MNSMSRPHSHKTLLVEVNGHRRHTVPTPKLLELGFRIPREGGPGILFVRGSDYESVLLAIYRPFLTYNTVRVVLDDYRRAREMDQTQHLTELKQLFRKHIKDCFVSEHFWTSTRPDHEEVLFEILSSIGGIPPISLKQLLVQIGAGYVGARYLLSNLIFGASEIPEVNQDLCYFRCDLDERRTAIDLCSLSDDRVMDTVVPAEYMWKRGSGRQLVAIRGHLIGVDRLNRLFCHNPIDGRVDILIDEPLRVRGWTMHNRELFVWTRKSVSIILFETFTRRFDVREVHTQRKETILRMSMNLRNATNSYNFIVQRESGTFGTTPFATFLMPNKGILLGGYGEQYVVIQSSDEDTPIEVRPASILQVSRPDNSARSKTGKTPGQTEYDIVHYYGYAVLAKQQIRLRSGQNMSSLLVGTKLYIMPEHESLICYDMKAMDIVPLQNHTLGNLFIVHKIP